MAAHGSVPPATRSKKCGIAWVSLVVVAFVGAGRPAHVADMSVVPCISVPNSAGQVVKIVDPITGACSLSGPAPGLCSYRALDSAVAARHEDERRQWGAVRGRLRSRLQTLLPHERMTVRIQLRTHPVKYPNRFTHSWEELRTFSLAIQEMRSVVHVGEFVRAYGLRMRTTVPNGYIEATISKSALERMMFDDRVAVVEEIEPPVPCGVADKFVVIPWPHLAAAALNPAPHPADRAGAGVRAATVEWDTTWDYYACRRGLRSTPRDATHADQTLGCLLNAAPAASIHHYNANNYVVASRWLADSAIETVSMSVGTLSTMTPDALECVVVDDLAYRWPFTVFCHPAGNGFAHARSMWASYNSLCVGSKKLWQERWYQADDFTSTRNPAPVYGLCRLGEQCDSDRELPEILAPGSHPYRPQGDASFNYLWFDPCFRGYFYGDGTSFAAPTANGVAARVISSAPRLVRGRPEAVKMALLLTATNVDGGEWNVAEDGRDGAGGISAYAAVEYLNRCTDLTGKISLPAVEHGFYTDTGFFGMTEREFLVRVPDQPPDSCHLRVVLVWTSNPDMTTYRNSLSDLDIGAFRSDAAWYGSYSLDANVEIFDVPRTELTPNATYSFRLFPRAIRIPLEHAPVFSTTRLAGRGCAIKGRRSPSFFELLRDTHGKRYCGLSPYAAPCLSSSAVSRAVFTQRRYLFSICTACWSAVPPPTCRPEQLVFGCRCLPKSCREPTLWSFPPAANAWPSSRVACSGEHAVAAALPKAGRPPVYLPANIHHGGTMSFGAIFDWDGVLVDSSAHHERSWELLAEEEGLALPPGHFKAGFGQKNERIIPTILKWTTDPAEIRRLSLRKEALYRTVMADEGISLLPGARELLRDLHRRGVPCAVGSSTHAANLEAAFRLLDIREYFAAVVSGEDVTLGKPDPQVFLLAAERIAVMPNRCVVFEDVPAGVEAALAAGMTAVAVTTTNPPAALSRAHLVVPNLSHVSVPLLTAVVEERNHSVR